MKLENGIQVSIILASAVIITASEMISKVYHLKALGYITTYEEAISAPSAVACIVKCSRSSTCLSCAYREATGECFLRVKAEPAEDAILNNIKVYSIDQTGFCDPSDAVRSTTNSTNVIWKPLGLEGNLTCHNDYIYSGDDPTIFCTPSGEWIADGTCRRKIWTNPPVSMQYFPFPRFLHVNWTMCAQGITWSSKRFSMNLESSDNHTQSHFDARFNYYDTIRKVIINSLVDNEWITIPEIRIDDFPFALGQPFEIEFHLNSMTDLQISVDGSELYVYDAPVSFANVSRFRFYSDNHNTSLRFLDLWSGCN